MKVCYFDAFSAISGDMTVGVLADAGVDRQAIIDILELGTKGAFAFETVRRREFGATKFHVTLPVRRRRHSHLPGILGMIDRCEAPARAKERAACVFETLGRAEPHVHRTPLEEVHFHEVGAADSIADVVGACVALELLGIDRVFCSPVNTGSGTVETEPGTLPVPASGHGSSAGRQTGVCAGARFELTTPASTSVHWSAKY